MQVAVRGISVQGRVQLNGEPGARAGDHVQKPGVKESMHVGAKQQAVAYVMTLNASELYDVRCL